MLRPEWVEEQCFRLHRTMTWGQRGLWVLSFLLWIVVTLLALFAALALCGAILWVLRTLY
jgi:hypothetical protein